MTRRALLWVAAITIAVSRIGAQEIRQQNESSTNRANKLRSDIQERWQRFTEAFIAGDAATATKAFFTDDAINIVSGSPDAIGRSAIDSAFKHMFSITRVISADRTTDEVELSGNLAYERGHLTEVTQQRQNPRRSVSAHYLAIWRQQPDSGWRCTRFSMTFAPATP
jgi:ketosteroid isomerase-like protein